MQVLYFKTGEEATKTQLYDFDFRPVKLKGKYFFSKPYLLHQPHSHHEEETLQNTNQRIKFIKQQHHCSYDRNNKNWRKLEIKKPTQKPRQWLKLLTLQLPEIWVKIALN
jgi:hypothetical protein